MNRFFLILGFFLVIISCKKKNEYMPTEGMWRAELEVMDNQKLPFNFKLSKNEDGAYEIEIYNAKERIAVDEIEIIKDSIVIKAPVFEGYIAGRFTPTAIQGVFVKESLERIVPFKATFGLEERFVVSNTSKKNISGIWETDFAPNTADTYKGKGIFTQQGDKVAGTFRTTTGDYRFLDGVMSGDSLKVSAFDGAHAFLFTAKVTDSTLDGTFYSGNHYKEHFVAKRNEAFELPSADSLTLLKKGYDKIAFSFPDENGKMISLDDEAFKNKVVVVQIMGTWCPNCLDETKFYVDYIKKNNDDDVAFVALAFEYAKTEKNAYKSIARLKKRIGVQYPILLAQYGSSDKTLAQKKLPMLNTILSYPTSIFVDKKGKVRKIHTGFNGPATGVKFEEFQTTFHAFINELKAE